ncbi:sigma factor [Xylanimonas sp. McL0601]|uniref:sigma factor n=1 Tax=Xylanimonas sp. McL0601 TaxID=3414739 RepID=UPI003CF81FEE
MSAPVSAVAITPQPPSPDLDRALAVFMGERPRLTRIAHRVVCDRAEAEDVVQEVWVRWQRADRTAIRNPAAFLTTATTNLAINVVQSARRRHESLAPALAPGAEAVAGPADLDPGLQVERSAAVEDALALLLRSLTPAELAAYVMRRCFGYEYAELAGVLGTSSVNARQLVSRAQGHLARGRERPVSGAAHRRLATAFRAAARTGVVDCLEAVLAPRAPAAPARAPRRGLVGVAA